MKKAIALMVLALAGCGDIKEQATMSRPAVAGRPYVAGAGDIVMDLRLTQSLPNAMGRADAFGRTRDAGRVVVRFLGIEGNQAVFARQDVVIQSNETTMSRSPMAVPTYSQTTGSGNFGSIPVSGSSTTTGLSYLPAGASTSYPIQAGQLRVAAPIGGYLLIEGRRLTVLRSVEGGIEYSAQ